METNKEKLTQPVGVEPIGEFYTDQTYYPTSGRRVAARIYAGLEQVLPDRGFLVSTDTVARLIAERDEWKQKAVHWDGMYKHERDLYDKLQLRFDTLQEQVKTLREALELQIKYRNAGNIAKSEAISVAEEALAATEPK